MFAKRFLTGLSAVQASNAVWPGRSQKDIQNILQEAAMGPDAPFLVMNLPATTVMLPNPQKRKPIRELPRSLCNCNRLLSQQLNLHPAQRNSFVEYHRAFVCHEASGSITSMAWNNVNSRHRQCAMIGACALSDQTYNRPGETLFLSFDQSSVACHILDGHSTLRSYQRMLHPYLFSHYLFCRNPCYSKCSFL